MTLTAVLSLFRKLLDVSIVWMIFYYILKRIRTNVKMVLIFKGILFIVIIKVMSDLLNLTTVGLLLEYIIQWGPIALIIVFQPEIRMVLEHLGKTQLLGRHKVLTVDQREKLVYEIIQACDYMKKARIGALIVIERDISLQDYIDKSKKLYADITSDLLIAIFFPNNPLHDGGTIIQGDQITSAGAVFPVSTDTNISKQLGTRHRAALGISSETDCISIVVSEETGRLSIAINNELHYNLTNENARIMLLDELRPKKEMVIDDDKDDEEEENLDEELN